MIASTKRLSRCECGKRDLLTRCSRAERKKIPALCPQDVHRTVRSILVVSLNNCRVSRKSGKPVLRCPKESNTRSKASHTKHGVRGLVCNDDDDGRRISRALLSWPGEQQGKSTLHPKTLEGDAMTRCVTTGPEAPSGRPRKFPFCANAETAYLRFEIETAFRARSMEGG